MKKIWGLVVVVVLGLSLSGGISTQANEKASDKKSEVTIYLVRHGKTFLIQLGRSKALRTRH